METKYVQTHQNLFVISLQPEKIAWGYLAFLHQNAKRVLALLPMDYIVVTQVADQLHINRQDGTWH